MGKIIAIVWLFSGLIGPLWAGQHVDMNLPFLGNNQQLISLFQRGVLSLDQKDKRQATWLHYAVEHNSVQGCIYLLQHGGHLINALDVSGATPLHSAAVLGNEEICKLLLAQKGVVVDTQDDAGATALHLAVLSGRANIVKMLLDAQPTMVCTKDNTGATPLHLVCAVGDEISPDARVAVCKALLDAGASINEPDFSGKTPLDYIKDQRIIAFLRNKKNIFGGCAKSCVGITVALGIVTAGLLGSYCTCKKDGQQADKPYENFYAQNDTTEEELVLDACQDACQEPVAFDGQQKPVLD